MGSILTTVGRAKLASATPENQLNITHVAVGDGNGGYPPLTPSMTSLSNEKWRGAASLPIRSTDQNVIIFEGFIPGNVGGFFVREVGIFDSDGDMIAIGQTAVVEKPDPSGGSPVTLSVRLHVSLDNASDVQLIYNDSPDIDHAGLGNRDAENSHPALSISTQPLPNLSQLASNVQGILALLDTAATKKAQTSVSDKTTGAAMLNGAHGLGGKSVVSANWNGITASGFYTNSNSSQGELPIAAEDLSLIHVETESNAAQICMRTLSSAPRTWRRSRNGLTWGAWVEIADDGYKIVTDANMAMKTGMYSMPASLGALNSPVPGQSGTLSVIQGGAGDAYITQAWTQSNETDEERVFVRHKRLVGWTAWVELYHSGNNDEVGSIKYFITTVTPKGRYIKANGAAISRAAYSDLFAKVGTFWGAGNGSTTFNVPDLRGEFIRTWDDGRGVDASRSFGSFQSDEFKSHSHQLNTTGVIEGSPVGPSFNALHAGSGKISSGTTAVGGTETRPRNVALIAWIRY